MTRSAGRAAGRAVVDLAAGPEGLRKGRAGANRRRRDAVRAIAPIAAAAPVRCAWGYGGPIEGTMTEHRTLREEPKAVIARRWIGI